MHDAELIKKNSLLFILGPCMMESEESVYDIAEKLVVTSPYPFIFKSSFDKANRTSIHSERGIGLEKGLRVLQRIKQELCLPVTTDIHTSHQADLVAQVVDLIQIPAFLCRQTDIILAAAKTYRPIHIKKGQFLSPQEMQYVVQKVLSTGNPHPILLTERGTFFGYKDLVCDMRSISIMKSLHEKVIVGFDATHSIQSPGGGGHCSSGNRDYVAPLARAAIASGADAIFIETHPNLQLAQSDAAIQFPLTHLPELLRQLHALYIFMQSNLL